LGLLAASSASLAGPVTAALTEGKEGVKKLLRGFTRWRCSPLWYAVAIVIPPAIVLIAAGISTIFGNPFPLPGPQRWAMLVPMFFILTVQAGLGEEIGWRGYATPKLSERYSVLVSSLIVGVVWACWHLPLYLFPGFVQHEIAQNLGFVSTFLMYSVFVVAAAVIYAWIYFVSGGNLWLPILLHGSTNAFGWFFNYQDIEAYGGITIMVCFTGLWIAAAVIVTVIPGIRVETKKE
jgi:membrane protease YdiL (CAAX protease family)